MEASIPPARLPLQCPGPVAAVRAGKTATNGETGSARPSERRSCWPTCARLLTACPGTALTWRQIARFRRRKKSDRKTRNCLTQAEGMVSD